MHFPLIAALLLVPSCLSANNPPPDCSAPPLPVSHEFKVMTYNIQMALGKFRRFWLPGDQNMPAKDQVEQTLAGIQQAIKEQQPDILLLQEASRGNVISHYVDQIAAIQATLGDEYCIRSEYYWNKLFVPMGQMWGPMDYSLVVFSRYRLTGETRITLLQNGSSWPVSWFAPQRILMETDLLTADGQKLTLLNTHLDAHDKGGSLRLKQAWAIYERIKELNNDQKPFILGGDFNLIPPETRRYLPPNQKDSHWAHMNMAMYYNDTQTSMVPSMASATGPERLQWTTAYDENLYKLDVNLDYLIFSKSALALKTNRVLQEYIMLSDHVPVMATFAIKPGQCPLKD